MKFIDILFALSAAATANAILVSDNSNDSVQASSTSSQVSGPTNEPEPGTSRQGQQYLLYRTDPGVPKRSRKRPVSEPGPSAPKRSRKQSTNQPGPSTSNQDQQQPMDEEESGNTAPSQEAVLSEGDQKILDTMKKQLEKLEKKEKNMCQAYYNSVLRGLNQWAGLGKGKGKSIPGVRYSPEVQKQLKEDCEEVGEVVDSIKQQVKKFMKGYGLEYEEPDSDVEKSNSDVEESDSEESSSDSD
ncbi:hypothetical protein BATDEDRAFT_92721 [Batrachochytrium dendrobatidis JAM81]|uniref:Uncharacterized protein n=2 Tax=Batrachochytrium dendrobatidis TaxID=109871 RepID=F4PEJ4_BATDJ|nr:uncharacterized protein BATDEDRAFT_92721 [Batrachochytrium dendrobatidis JAM81]EGF76437.1 hypothetical protein BATDEDRAFT_92721 [Batrachochytrium dendrobatidis JAM81]OAJ45354.1 hypothetical protein BDEG_28501 [Batrachochytrium dendrobatidis JEL423]|eukprot:XP_006683032.1 hypothetical protein BATDEDRAFT_92721 [Batrachochytrium dendrobatidis JAM81]